MSNESKQDPLVDKMASEYEEFKKNQYKVNILVMGASGVGKSAMINTIFGKEIAKTGVGKPVTTGINVYEDESLPIRLFDSEGYEVGSEKQKQFNEAVISYIDSTKTSPTAEEQIHIAWYCISAPGERIVDYDLQLIDTISKKYKIPTAVVFTKCDLTNRKKLEALKNEIQDTNSFAISTQENFAPDYIELNELINWSKENLEDSLNFSFISAQKANLDLKRQKANNVIIQHAAGSGTIGASPIPGSDAPGILASQSSMIYRIMYIYDLEHLLKESKMLINTVGAELLVSNAGRWLAGTLIKLIPVAGSYVGGAVNATVAIGFTYAIGYAIDAFCYQLYLKILEGDEDEIYKMISNIAEFIKTFIKEYFQKNKL